MTADKESKTPIADALKKQLIGILLGLTAIGYTVIKDLIATGAEVKHKSLVVNIVVEDPVIKDYIEEIIEVKITKTMQDPSTWLAVLENDFLTGYTDKKTTELRHFISQKIEEVDSAQKAFYSQLGALSGDRDENVLKVLGAMMQDYKKKTLNTVHVPTL